MAIVPEHEDEVLGTSERVLLRHLRARDEDELLLLRRASWDFLAPWEPVPPEGIDPLGPSWFRLLLAGTRDRSTERLVLERRSDGALLGLASLSQIHRGPFQNAYLGYWIGAPHARQGYMGEGLPLAIDRAFGSLRLHRLEANVRPDNAASIALVRRLGFRREGFSPRYLQIAGEWHDHERWALLADEWRGGS